MRGHRAGVDPASRLRRRRVDHTVGSVLVLATLVHATSTLWRPSGWDLIFDLGAYNVVFGAAAVLSFRAAAACPPERWAWRLLGAGLVAYLGGNVYGTFVLGDIEEPPYPSAADAMWLAMFPLAYAAMILLIRARVHRFQASVWLDGLVSVLGAVALADAFALHLVLTVTGGAWSTVVTNLAYPIGDLMLISVCVAGARMIGSRPGATWWLLTGGFASFVVADSIFAIQISAGTYVEGAPPDAVWTLAGALIGVAAWRRDRPVVAATGTSWIVMAQPMVFAVTSLGLLVSAQYLNLPRLAGALAAACLLVGALRTGMTFHEVRALAEARRQAGTDDLTGLPNRRALLRRLDDLVAGPVEGRANAALLLIDLDRFKEVNDAFGHHVGDELLRQIGPRLTETLRTGDLLARLGGDEFAVILPALADRERARTVADGIRRALTEPFTLTDVRLHIDASIGIVLYPDHATDSSGLLQGADIAMYEAKAARDGHRVYEPEQHVGGDERMRTIEALRAGIAGDEITLHYQPKINLASGRMVGVEALVRWNHPARGLVSPAEFIPLAEHAGLMRPLTHRVLEVALAQLRAWLDDGLHLTVAVNLSTSNLLDADLPDWIARLLAHHGLPAGSVELEITESTLMADPDRAREVLQRLRALGISISIDDYGTGYSSLAYLQRLDVAELKIDRCFIKDMGSSPRTAAIVRSTIDLAHALGLTIVAEGVETTEAATQLADYGCDLAQGYRYSPPLPANELRAWLHRERLPVPRSAP
jgi:diguanylate cyclase (GGDEF)-like protein